MRFFYITMFACGLLVFISIYYTLKSAIKPKKNMVMAVTLPEEVIQSEYLEEIKIQYKAICQKLYIIMGVTLIPTLFPFSIFKNITVYIIYFTVWSIFFSYYSMEPIKKMNRKIKLDKAKNNWFVGEKKVVSCDTKTTMLKNSMPLSDKYYLIPLLISVIPIILVLKDSTDSDLALTILAFFNLVIVIGMFFFSKSINKAKLKVYSKDTDINYALNRLEKRCFSIYFFIAALLSALLFLATYLIMFEYLNSNLFIVLMFGTIIASMFLVIGFIYIKNKIDSLESELLSKNPENEIIIDEDDYWIDGIFYCNPNDKSTLVSSRIGFNMTYNIATKKGYFMTKKLDKIVIAITAVVCLGLLLPLEFTSTKVKLNQSSPNIEISSFPYSYELDYDNIESIELTDKPISFTLRTNGTADGEKCIGNFKHKDYGKCRVYFYYKANDTYILAKLRGVNKFNYLILNTKDSQETKNLYYEIEKNLK